MKSHGKLKLADDLELPADSAASQVYAFMGRRGSGKTYAAGRLVEQVAGDGGQFCVVDPVGIWWGLRLAEDGKTPGLDVPVFGGQHGDLPLPHTAGKVLAEMLATRSTSMVLDVSDMTISEQRAFVAEFAGELFQAKKRHKSPVLVLFEECQEFVPQHVMGEQSKMVSAMQRLVKLGRNYGIGAALISQRPQAVNKDVLNQTEMMLAFQLTGPQERKAIAGWVQEVGAGDRDIADQLPGLKTGTCIAWSPSWLEHFGRHKIAAKWTYDASATPSGRQKEAARELPALDLEELKTALEEAKVEVVEHDPKALKAEVARLRRELDAASRSNVGRVIEKPVEVPVVPKSLIADLRRQSEMLIDVARQMAIGCRLLDESATELQACINDVETRSSTPANGRAPRPAAVILATPLERPRWPAPAESPSFGGGDGGAAPARMLRALAARAPEPCSKRQLATLAGVPIRTSTFRNAVSKLSTSGYIERRGEDLVALTKEGLAAAGDVPRVESSDELLAMWLGKVKGKAKDMLEFFATEGRPITKAELAEHVRVDPALSTFRNAMSQLRSRDLIRKTSGGFIINPELAQ